MKKRILSLLLALAMLLGMLPVLASAETATPEIVKTSMTLASVLNVNFKVDFKDADPSGYSLRITIGDTVTQTVTKYSQEYELYVYTADLLAHKMHETVTAELLSGETVVDSKTWTVADYVDGLEEAYPEEAEMLALTQALENYGAYAAYYAGEASDPAISAVQDITPDLESYKHEVVTSGIYTVAYLYLDEACDIGLKFNTADMEGKTLYVDGTAVETSELSDTQVGYRITGILPQDYGVAHSIVVTDGEETALELNYSVLSYVRQALGQATELATGLNGLLKSMYLYSQAAAAYQTYMDSYVSLTFRDGGTNRLIYISKTTPTLNVDFFVTADLEDVTAGTVLATAATVYVNGAAHTAKLTYQKETTGNLKGYIQVAVENPKGWTPTEGGDDYASDPAVTMDLLIPAGIDLGSTGKQTTATRYLLYKSEGLSQNDTHPRKALTAETADPEAYVFTANITGIRGGSRAIYVSKATPRLDLEFYLDADLGLASGTVLPNQLLVYVNGAFHYVTATYYIEATNSGNKYYIAFSVENPKGWTPTEGGDDYASDPAATFDVLIPAATELGDYQLEAAARYIFTKTEGLEQTSVHPRKALTAEAANADEYEYETIVTDVEITDYRTSSRAIYVSKTTPKLDLDFFVDGPVADAAGETAATDVTVYVNGKAYTTDIVYQIESINGQDKGYIQLAIENPDGWTPTEGGDDYTSDPAATFDVLIPEGIQFVNGAKLNTAVRYIFTKTEGLEQTDTHPRKALTAVAADADSYEIINFVNSTGFRYGRAIYINKSYTQLNLEFYMDAVLENTSESTETPYPVASGVTVYVNGKPSTVDIGYNASTYVITVNVTNPYGWTPVEGEDDFASDPEVNFDVLIPAGIKFSDGHVLENAIRYIVNKSEGLSQNDTHPRKQCTAEIADASEYEYLDKVNVTGFRWGRAIYISKTTPQLDLNLFVDMELAAAANTTVATGATVYVNKTAYTVDMLYLLEGSKPYVQFSISGVNGWTPVEGDDNYASDPAIDFDVLIPAGTAFINGETLASDVRYIVSKPEGLDASTSHPRVECTGTAKDPSDYFVDYVDFTSFRWGRAIYISETTPQLDLNFWTNMSLAEESGTVIASGVTMYINGTAHTVDMKYIIESSAEYVQISIQNPTGWTPVKGDDNYASDPAVDFNIVIPAGITFVNGEVLKSDVCYTVTKPAGLDASTSHPRVNCTATEAAYIVKNGETSYAIVTPASADTQTANAAAEMALYFEEATGIALTTYSDAASIPSGTKLISIGATTYASAALGSTEVAEEGYRITTADSNIYVLGNGYGVLEGTYELLGQLLGYEFYKAGVVAGVDTNDLDVYTLNTGVTNLKFVAIEQSAAPDITYMPTNYHGLRESDHYRYTFNNEGAMVAGTASTRWHNSFVALDPSVYGEAHSDWYYAETTGFWLWTSTDNIQLCYTAHGDEDERQAMIATAVDYYVSLLQEYPTRSYVSFSMEDNAMWCSCDACNAAKATYGANSGAMLVMASQIRTGIMEKLAAAGDTRDIKVLAMIYSSCEDLPAVESNGTYAFDADFLAAADAEGLANVVPVWATMATKDHAKGWNDDANAEARTMMAKLNALFGEFWVWDYAVNFHDYLLPLNTFDTVSEDMQYLASQENLKLYLYQCDHDAGNTTAFGGLKTYLMSALRWNAELDVDTLTDNYFSAVYGAGADAMKQLYNEYLNLAAGNSWNESIYSDTMLTAAYWPEATVEGWLELIDQAKTAAAGDTVALENITVESIFVRYIYAILYSSDTTFKTELNTDVLKYFARIGEGSSRAASTLAAKLGL